MRNSSTGHPAIPPDGLVTGDELVPAQPAPKITAISYRMIELFPDSSPNFFQIPVLHGSVATLCVSFRNLVRVLVGRVK